MLTQVLGDFGAEVIKVEPPAGDTLRAWRTKGVADPLEDLRPQQEEPRPRPAQARAPASSSARSCRRPRCFVESFRPGMLEKMGSRPTTLLALNPRLVIVRISGWGQDGPYRAAPGLRHAGRGHVRLCRRSTGLPTASRCCRRCTSPTALPASTAPSAVMIALREVERTADAGR